MTVGPRWVDASHPAAQLRGAESLVTYTTRRYSDYPMRIQGPGAGAAVTAAGVLADILAVERTTRFNLVKTVAAGTERVNDEPRARPSKLGAQALSAVT